MAEKRNPLDSTGEAVRANVKAHRERLNLGYADLSRRTGEHGRAIPVLGLSRIEKGERRVDVDDLVSLALALEISPISLLMPEPTALDPQTPVIATGFDSPVPARALWEWLRAESPPTIVEENSPEARHASIRFSATALPSWRVLEIAEGIRDIAALEYGTEAERETIREKYSRGDN